MMMKQLRYMVIAALVVVSARAHASEPVQVEQFTLKNGMEVIVIPNHRIPAISHMLWFRIGAADEPHGASGVAHYLEHMMFKGTPSLKVGEYSQILSKHGGEHNAFTGNDFTGYYVNIAKEHLPLVMRLEADRMVNLRVDDAEFLKEREVIMEERSMRVDNQPAALLHEQMTATLFQNHPYHTPIVGWRHEMEALTREQVFDVYHRFYHPNNAVLVVAGDITAEALRPLAERYYGILTPGDKMLRAWPTEPQPQAERRVILRDEKVLQPAWSRYYIAPSYVYGETSYSLPLALLAQIAGGSQTSRLYQSLVVEQKIATNVSAYYDGVDLGPSTFVISATPAEGIELEQLEHAVDAVLAHIIADGPAPEEMKRAKTQAKAEVVYARDGLQSLAYIMGMLRMIGLDAEFFNSWPNQIAAVTDDQVRDTASWLFNPKRSVTGWLLPVPSTAQQEEEKDAE